VSVTQPDPDGAGPLTAPVTTFAYDAVGQLLSTTDPLGRTTGYTYDSMGRQLTVTLPDPDGAGPLAAPVTTYTYGADGRLASATDFASQTVSYSYNSAGLISAMTDPRGTTTFTYDALGRALLVTEPDPDGAGPLAAPFKLHAYNDAGELESVTTAAGTTSYAYDALGQVTKVTMPDPDGAGPQLAPWTVYTYDLSGRTTSETNRLGHATQFQYDNLGRLIKTTDAEAGETTYSYDAKGNRLTLTDPVANTTTWVYDLLDRVVSETNSLSKTRQFEYDTANNLVEFTDRNGRVTTYDYDNLHRRTSETWLDGSTPLRTFSYSYDAASQLVAASDPSASYTFTFDGLGRNTSVEHALTVLSFEVVVDHAYDPLGRRTALAVEIDGTADLVNQYQYDYLNRVTRITQAGQSGGNAVAEKRVDFDYDLEFKNRFAAITRYADLAGTETVAISNYGYDFAGRLTAIGHRDGASVLLAGYGLSYDQANRLTEFLVAGYSAEDVIYNYDDTDQLIAADRDGSGNDESYSYDANGNRTLSGYSTGGNNQLLSDGTFNYAYDDEGNRLSKTNIATGELVEYSWDHRNRLTGIVTKDSLGIVTHEVQYTYDIFNRRIVKTIDADGAGSGTPAQEIYIYDGLREERGNAGDHILLRFDESEALTGRYLHGPNVDQILASEDVISPTAEGDVLWALTDHLGSVRDLAEYDAGTDTTSVVNHIVYDAYGRIVSETNSGVDFLYGFTGRERDTESDLQYNRARYYDAAIGRWMSQDPIGFDAGDANLYRYVRSLPTAYADPSGLFDVTIDPIYIELEPEITGISESDEAKAEGQRIAKALVYTIRNNWRFRPSLRKNERFKGYFCYDWAYAFEDAFNLESKGEFFKVDVQSALDPDTLLTHFWIRITSLETGEVIYFDDSFWDGTFVHTNMPCGGNYQFDMGVRWSEKPRHKTSPPPAYDSHGWKYGRPPKSWYGPHWHPLR